jgi:hypothetical protein
MNARFEIHRAHRSKRDHQDSFALNPSQACDPTPMEITMKALVIAALVTLGVGSVAVAQQRSVRDMMNDMKTRYGQTFEQCQALATSRGYRLSDDEQEGRLVMMFIEGCIMGKQN